MSEAREERNEGGARRGSREARKERSNHFYPLILSLFTLHSPCSSQSEPSKEGDKIVDNLIDSMMLGDDELISTEIPNPAIRSLNRTLIKRITKGPNKEDDARDVVDCVGEGDLQLDPPGHILEGAKGASADFIKYYGIEVGFRDDGKDTAKKRRFWSEALDADSDEDEELL